MHLVTGATGLLGSALTVELLRANPDDVAYCVVRPRIGVSIDERISQSLRGAGLAYAVPDSEIADVLRRTTAIRGDILAHGLALEDQARVALRAVGPVVVWHCAASLKDDEQSLSTIAQHNIFGTMRLLGAMFRIGVEIFNHVSTAYVAGTQLGTIDERRSRPDHFSNRYEWSKFHGEGQVVAACERAGVPYRLLRPAIITAHSRTARATSYNAYLGWALKLAMLDDLSRGRLQRQPLGYCANPDAASNLVPIDAVVGDCAGIDAARAATHNRVFHLSNSQSPSWGHALNLAAEAIGIHSIKFDRDPSGFDALSKRFHSWTRFERPYVSLHKQFDRDETLYASDTHGACPLTDEDIRRSVRLAVDEHRSRRRRERRAA